MCVEEIFYAEKNCFWLYRKICKYSAILFNKASSRNIFFFCFSLFEYLFKYETYVYIYLNVYQN